jgi:hypothetical protein
VGLSGNKLFSPGIGLQAEPGDGVEAPIAVKRHEGGSTRCS